MRRMNRGSNHLVLAALAAMVFACGEGGNVMRDCGTWIPRRAPTKLKALHQTYAGKVGHSFSEVHDVPWENWSVPYRDESEEITGIVDIAFNLTSAKSAEKELKEKLALIERRAEGIITGIQPGVAQTMVMLGMNMDGIVTLRSLRDGLKFCMARMATRTL